MPKHTHRRPPAKACRGAGRIPPGPANASGPGPAEVPSGEGGAGRRPAMSRLSPRLCALVVLAMSALTQAVAQDLPRLNLVAGETTVSGLSSGAYMAGQMHLAFSRSIAGAGLVAGGPWGCARGSLNRALSNCTDTDADGPSVEPLLALARRAADLGAIDPLEGLEGDRVYLFSGTRDRTVEPPVVRAAARFLQQAGIGADDMRFSDTVPAGHALLVEGAANECGTTAPPFLADCGIDQARDILTWLLGTLDRPRPPRAEGLRRFSQAPFLADVSDHSLGEEGFVYVPESCAGGAPCRLHVAFHGCRQTVADIGALFAAGTGYNRWAEANGIVVLYPQARASPGEGNPNGCWDWWGYDDPDYLTQNGPQIVAVGAMAAALGVELQRRAPVCITHRARNWQHLITGRARPCGLVSLCAAGDGGNLGSYFGLSTIYEDANQRLSASGCGAR